MSFEVASVKENKSGNAERAVASVPLDSGDALPKSGGLFSATNFPLWAYIGFAYKLPVSQGLLLDAQLPIWADADRFDIQARASSGATKDQMRLMMQSLLGTRFKLMAHFQSTRMSVFALVLQTPGRTGPQLQPHSDSSPCADPPKNGSAPRPVEPPDGGLPSICGAFGMRPVSGHVSAGARKMTIAEIVGYLPTMGTGIVDRPVVDRTGLHGEFDFYLNWSPNLGDRFMGAPAGSAPDASPDETAPTFLEALKDQLGLKLVSTTGPVDTLVVDHIEEPTAN